ncbi:zonular occludens toxin domain-containing protein [Ectopseudomonas guguanensis]|uniref:Zona occludens toxin n=1 Tax=Ectopseudomonas guguanensis TaxID=1198456 RepID=A0A1H0XEK1_9GAMM|nr:zonular occludens toxin domain-containing protein [Pseudomonas guguanensis]SDQ01215.1 zona occludens toxin [Pseudomonas guguanensis]
MSIKIHHGPNGSYKTCGAIQDDAVPALKEGRLIITNVRGFTLERVLQVMPDLPEWVDIINLDLEQQADMERMRTWFQWAPRGAFIIFDETQLVFPKAWRERDLERFDFPGGSEAAQAADRPMNWLDGWTRHRHWNWDVVLTTPNISYIRDDIRMTCEMAYKHSNLAVIGIKGRYKEAQHDAQLNRPPAEGTIIEYKRIKPDTFRLYQSTATGKAQDTKAGKSLLKSPKLLFLLAFIACLFVALLSLGTPKFGSPGGAQAPAKSAVPAASPGVASPALPPDTRTDPAGDLLVNEPPDVLAGELNHPYAPRTFAVRAVMVANVDGQIRELGQFDVIDADGQILRQSLGELRNLGYLVRILGPCVVHISHPMGYVATALCPGRPQQRDASGTRQDLNGISAAAAIGSTGTSKPPPTVSALPVNVVPNSEYAARPWR